VRALVTGATGFIGRALTRELVAAGDRVTCLVRPTSNRAPLEALGVDFALGDVTQPETLAAAVADVDVVYHLAAMLMAPWSPDFLATNSIGVRNVLAPCAARAKPPRVVLVSSLAAAGPSGAVPRTEDDPPAPVSRYGASKLGGEAAAREYADRLQISMVRPPLVFGPGDGHLLPAYKLAQHGIGFAYSDAAYSMIHVDDLAALLRVVAVRGEPAARTGPLGQGIYFVGAELAPTQPEMWRLIGTAIGRRDVRVVRLPPLAVRAMGAVAEIAGRLTGPSLWSRDKAREATAGSWTCSTAKARSLGWLPAQPLEDRLAGTGEWYRAQGML